MVHHNQRIDRLLKPEQLLWRDGRELNIQDEASYVMIKGMLIDNLYKLNPDYLAILDKYLAKDWNNGIISNTSSILLRLIVKSIRMANCSSCPQSIFFKYK